jgi:TrmH family RNA methyltransferase
MPISKAHISRLRLLHHKSARIEAKMFIAEGEKLVEDLLESGMQAHELFMLEAARNRFEGNAFTNKLSDKLFTVNAVEMERITSLSSASPVLGVFAMKNQPEIGSLDVEGNLVLALDDIRDPGNLGTIIRTADWFGIRTILCSPDTVELYNPKVVQATMGSLARVDVYYLNLVNVINEFATKVPAIRCMALIIHTMEFW